MGISSRPTWGGSWSGRRRALRQDELGAADPGKHSQGLVPVDRDDSPPLPGTVPWEMRSDVDLRRGTADGELLTEDHTARGDHSTVTSPIHGGREAAPGGPDVAESVTGDHWDADPYLNTVVAAHGGLRADNGSAWANPDGYRAGRLYTPLAVLRNLPTLRNRPEIQAVGTQRITTGDQGSPPAEHRFGPVTSIFDNVIGRVMQVSRPIAESSGVELGETPAELPSVIGQFYDSRWRSYE